MVLIGSRALQFWMGEDKIHIKEDADWDVMAYEHESAQVQEANARDIPGISGKLELHSSSEYLSGDFMRLFKTDHSVYFKGLTLSVCSLRGLAAIKRSHLALDWQWEKHIGAYHKYLKPYLNTADMPLIKAREKITLEGARQKNPSLMQDNTSFFMDAVKKTYDHDWLHELVAYEDQPMYTKLKQEGKQHLAWCEKDLWEQMDFRDKLKCISEEATVIAIERWMVPSSWQHNSKIAFYKALKKVCTTLTSGWFRDFAIDNYDELRHYYRVDVFEKVKQEVKQEVKQLD